MTQLPPFLDCYLAAQALRVTPQTVRDLCGQGKLRGAIRLQIGWIIPRRTILARATHALPTGGRPLGYRPRPRKSQTIPTSRARRRRTERPPILPREIAQAMARRAFELSTPYERRQRASLGGKTAAMRMSPEQLQTRARAGALARHVKKEGRVKGVPRLSPAQNQTVRA